jgi:NAD(P)H-hydrate epimerase
MSVLVTPDEMRAAEAAAIADGRPQPELMREASSQIAAWLEAHIPERADGPRRAVALVGPGNNGGDALVTLASLIERGWEARAIYLGRMDKGDLPASPRFLSQIRHGELSTLANCDVILDGVFGVGGRPAVPDDVATAFRHAHESRVLRGTPLIAIDVPSGIDPGSGAASDDAFRADVTLCLGLPKLGLVREPAATHVGELVLLDIGIAPPPADERPVLIDEMFVRRTLPRRQASAHKHQTGTVLVIGGAPTYYGAPRLSAEAAARAGAGMICVAIPAAIVSVVAAQVPELVLLPLGESPERSATQILTWIEQRGGNVDALVVGPGLGQSPEAFELLERLFAWDNSGLLKHVKRVDSPGFIFDADALNWISARGEFPKQVPAGSAVLTPHAGELARLTGVPARELLADPLTSARDAAARFGQTVVFKTGFAIAASPGGETAVAPRSAPELATAGTGDVLAGLIGGLLAQGLDPFSAAQMALYIGSQAGRRARTSRGLYGVLARDVIDEIAGVMRRLTEPVLKSVELRQTRGEM